MTTKKEYKEALKNSIAFYLCEIKNNFQNLIEYSLDVYITKSNVSRQVVEFTLLVTSGGPRIELVFKPSAVYLNYYAMGFISVENFVCVDSGYFDELAEWFIYDAI